MSSSHYDNTCHESGSHFLRACFMCNKQLGLDHDIFMYRGNTPFCSDECRQKQIQMDDHSKKKKKKKSSSTLKRAAEAPPHNSSVHKK